MAVRVNAFHGCGPSFESSSGRLCFDEFTFTTLDGQRVVIKVPANTSFLVASANQEFLTIIQYVRGDYTSTGRLMTLRTLDSRSVGFSADKPVDELGRAFHDHNCHGSAVHFRSQGSL